MRSGPIGHGPVEQVGGVVGPGPSPMLEGYGMATTQALLVTVKIGLLEPIADASLPATDLAARCGTNPVATEKLLNLLVTMGYVDVSADGAYRASQRSRRWLLGKRSLADSVRMKELEWRWIEGLEGFVRGDGRRDAHAHMSDADWALYQRGMRANATAFAPLVARRTPVPKGARDMLDIGGSHGHLAAAICRRHPGLRAVVLDLPEAIAHAAPLLAEEGMGDRVVHRAGDALTDDLGAEAWDVIFMMSLVHHFDDATNRGLVARCAAALRPGGVLVISETIRLPPQANDQAGALFDLLFSLTSRSGLWTYEEMADWQRDAGLTPRAPIRLPLSRGNGLQAADKPA